VEGQRRHLGEVAHRRFGDVALPVRVGGEADRGVEGQVRWHGIEPLGIEGQHVLQALDAVGDQRTHGTENQ